MQNRCLFRAGLIDALCAVSACAPAVPAAIAIDQRAADQVPSQSIASTFSLRVSSESTVRAEHYEVPPDFDSDVAAHPYTSGLGPCPHGGPGKVNCSSDMVPPSHYNH